jgi:hypothetical protein
VAAPSARHSHTLVSFTVGGSAGQAFEPGCRWLPCSVCLRQQPCSL